jgi:hypothetical protein
MKYDKEQAKAEAIANGHTKRPLSKVIRDHCTGCSGDSSREAELCTVTRCDLHPYRRGKNPFTDRVGGNLPQKSFSSKVDGNADESLAQITN